MTQSTLMDPKPDERQQEVSLWDEADPGSLINLVPEIVAKRFTEARAALPELFELDEQDLARELRKRNQTPTATDHRLRLKFWLEYDKAKDSDSKIEIKQVTSNVCSKEFFYAHYLARPGKVAWLVCPPVGYATKMTEALEFGLEQLRDILAADHYEYTVTRNADGEETKEISGINPKIAALKLSIFKTLDDRKHGMAVQKIEAKAQHLHASIPANDRKLLNEFAQKSTEDELQERLKQVQRREREVMHVPEIDAKIVPEEKENS